MHYLNHLADANTNIEVKYRDLMDDEQVLAHTSVLSSTTEQQQQ
jgi:hypothetical protein